MISQTGERADRDGAVDDLCEGVFACPFPPAPARPLLHMSRGHVGLSRRAPIDQLGWSAPSLHVEHVAHPGEHR
jgi:hypothetical protein